MNETEREKRRTALLDTWAKNLPPVEQVLEHYGNWAVVRIAYGDEVILSVKWFSIEVQSLIVGRDEVCFGECKAPRPIPRWAWEVLAAAVAVEPPRSDPKGEAIAPPGPT